ncbi:hypothetical protein L3Q82_025306, partial [Scortum barcoo]
SNTIIKFAPWCQDNNLHLNISKTKELMDFRTGGLQEEAERGTRPPLHQRDHGGESQLLQPDSAALLPPCRLRRLNMDSRILCSFYRCTIESIHDWLHHRLVQQLHQPST